MNTKTKIYYDLLKKEFGTISKATLPGVGKSTKVAVKVQTPEDAATLSGFIGIELDPFDFYAERAGYVRLDNPLPRGWTEGFAPDGYHILTMEQFKKLYPESVLSHAQVLKVNIGIHDRLKSSLEAQLAEIGNISRGHVCKFWNEEEAKFEIGILEELDGSNNTFLSSSGTWYKNAKKLSEDEVTEILFGEENNV